MLTKDIIKQKDDIIKELRRFKHHDIARYILSDKLFYNIYLLVYTKGRVLRKGKVSDFLIATINKLILEKEELIRCGNEERKISRVEQIGIFIEVSLYLDSVLVLRKSRIRLETYGGESILTFVLYELYYGLLDKERYDGPKYLSIPKNVIIDDIGNNKRTYDEDDGEFNVDGDVGLFSSKTHLQSDLLESKELIGLLKEYYGNELIDCLLDGNSMKHSIRECYATDDKLKVDRVRKKLKNSKKKFMEFLESEGIYLGEI